MSYGVTDAGFVPKRLADIKAELEAAYRSSFGAAINVDPRAPFGQIIAIHSEREALIWELMEIIYNSRYPDVAEGTSLDGVASITNVERFAATKSAVIATVSGTNGTVVPVGFVVSVDGDTTARFVSLAEGTISGGTVDIEFEAEETGAIQALAGTLTVIETPISGVTSVTNALDATVGRDTETDAQLRIRRYEELNRAGTATVDGIRNNILEVENVTQAFVIENDTGEEDEFGQPAHSFQAVVQGGDEDEIAQAIFEAKGAGIQAYGDTEKTVTDSYGFTHTIGFSRPEEIDIYIRVTVTPNEDPDEGPVYPDDGDQAVEDAVLAWISANWGIGHDVVPSQLYTPINTVDGIIGITVEVSLNGADWQTTNITVYAHQLAVADSTRTTVVS